MNDISKWGIENPVINFEGSEDTLAFETLITRDGKPLLLASNDGRGGSNFYSAAFPEIDIQTQRQARQELKQAVSAAVRAASDHSRLQFEVTDMWVTWKLTAEKKGMSFEEFVRGIEQQLRTWDEPVDEAIIEAILEADDMEKKKYVYVVADQEGKVVGKGDTWDEAESIIKDAGGKARTGLSIWMKQKGASTEPKKGDSLDPDEAKFGGFSSPGKMPCKSLSYPAGQEFTCPRGSKLMKVPGTVCYFCYGADGLYITPSVQLAQDRRFNSLKYAKRFPARQEAWISSVVKKLSSKRNPYYRWHETGDIQDEAHWNMILEVIRRTPHINHWIPTKEQNLIYEWLDEYGQKMLPLNLNIRVSASQIGKRIRRIRSPLTTSSVSDVEADLIPEDPGRNCPATWDPNHGDKCGKCRACWIRSVPNVNYKLHLGSVMKGKRQSPEYQDWVKSQGGVYAPKG